uniref:Uncharacterized protein n=1 Tax=Aegilops tauschii TaxID=37682 RepID=M8BB98_AEGTA
MSSTRKVRNVNKRYAKINEDWPEKDATVVHKNKVRITVGYIISITLLTIDQRNIYLQKKKLSDLGSQWSKDELERFYAAYRKYGKDWRKVAGAVHDRTSDMVEALYNMNRAYLSLPEGTATAAGLIAMMTDHYNILDGSNSDHESNGSPKTSRKPQKRGRAKLQSVSKASDTRYPDLLQSQPASSSYGCLSLLKKKRSGASVSLAGGEVSSNNGAPFTFLEQRKTGLRSETCLDLFVGNKPRAVGKRTPRVPVASMYQRDDKIGPSNRQAKPDANNGDDEGALAALALAEVCQRGSPQVSQTSGRSSGQMFLSPGKSIDRKNADSEMGSSKMHGFQVEADYPEGSLGSREAETGDYPKDASYFLNNEGSVSGKSKPKVKRSQKRRKKAAHKTEDQFEDDREACSGTEEGCSSRKAKDISDLDVFGSKGSWPSNKSNKRSRQLFFGDELSALDALHTLADISVNILQPSSIAESESSAQFKDGSKDNESDDKPSVPAAVSLFDKKDKPRKTKKIKRQSEIAGNEVVTRKKARLSKDHHHDGSTSEVKQDDCKCGVKMEKKKRKSSILKISKDEKNTLKDSEKTEASAEEGKVSSNKGRHTHVSPVSKQNKSKAQESSPAHADLGKEAMDTVDTTENAITQQSDSASKSKSRRKLGILKALAPESKPAEGADDSCDNVSYPVNNINLLINAIICKDKLSHCLSSRFLRRWCMSEWFYSAIDYPWFAKSEFVEYLNHVKLGHVPRLTRVEWGVIRSSLGKPRRLSKQFLQEEREKLSQYRESVRQHYAELQSGVREGLPTDLARPLAVGQRVIACHPKTRELHDGSVLTVDRNRCRVQFDRPELGVEFVMVAVTDPNKVLVDEIVTLQDIDCMPLHPLENFPESLRRQNIVNKYYSSFSEVKFEDRSKEYGGGGAPRFIPNEALLVELRHMNEEVSGKQKDGEIIRDLEHFRKQYAMVLVQLRDSNDHVASALLCLRQRNTFHGQPTQSYPNKSTENGGAFNRTPDPSSNLFGYINQESGSQVMEIIETSRSKAKTMVDVAVQAMCKVSEGENAFAKIGEALDNLNLRGTGSGSSILGIRRIPPDSGQANSDNSASGRFDPAAATNNISSPRVLPNGSDSEAQFPSELISSCVATILMIQNCTEKQYHPAEVAHILDSALSRLQPCSSQNVPIFREIEMCMGIIKNQMLALIPTPSG